MSTCGVVVKGSTLMKVGDCERRLGAVEREFIQTSAVSFLTPLRNFLEGDWRTISRERRLLENLRLDLDACKTRVKKAKAAEAKAVVSPDSFPRPHIFSFNRSNKSTQCVLVSTITNCLHMTIFAVRGCSKY
ncbi:Endophilin-B2 [Ameca splendens]|uniref:Endophilin-B2 n=1 Tax=Ameca splendens TaxID=208324 RepID=A0ABV0ZFY6_9TELE